MSEYLVERAPVFCVALDAQGVIRESNSYTETFVGRQLAGTAFRKILVDFTGAIDPFSISQEEPPTRLINVETHMGLPQSLVCSFFPVDDGVLVVGAMDIEEQERFRREILSLNQQLGNLTRELQLANAELARLNELKNQFLAMATHDLRKPAALIATYGEFLRDEAGSRLSPEHLTFVERILDSSRFMQRLIDDFLDVAMIESGHLTLDSAPTDVCTLVERALSIVALQAQRKGIRLQIDCDTSVGRASLDGPKMEQVLMNLVGNAIEHSDTGSKVVVRVTRESSSLIIEVEDHGQGIPEDALKRLFSPYERVGVRKTGGEKSTGLGLVIARKVVESHGGRIAVDSHPGHGTTFRVVIPIETVKGA
jgi:signal transduction histidine kinase